MNDIAVSFCIPVYNNAEAAEIIVNGLLASGEKRFEVVVCDDASNDDVQERLARIHDERFRYVRNDANLGALRNWLKSLELGRGEWLYLVMGRDKLHSENIDRLIDMLLYAGEHNITCLKDRARRNAKDIQVYKGMDAMLEFLVHDHPTGIIFRRKEFIDIPERSRYFETSDMYPECLIEYEMIKRGDAAIIKSGVFLHEEPVIDKTLVKSAVDLKTDLYGTFFAPARRLKQFYERIDIIANDYDFSAYERNKFFGNKFKAVMKDVSVWWRTACKDREFMAHYGHETRDISRSEMIRNIFTAYKEVKAHLKDTNTYTYTKQVIMYYYVFRVLMRTVLKAR